MQHYMGIDVSKQTLSLFDGVHSNTVANTFDLEEFQVQLQQTYGKRWKNVRLIYEPTGPYAYSLRRFAAKHAMKVYVINPKQSAHFKLVLGFRSKTDLIDAKMLYHFKDLLGKEKAQIPNVDVLAVRLSSYLKAYAFIQKARKMVANHFYAQSYDDHCPAQLIQALKQETLNLHHLEITLSDTLKSFAENTEELQEDFARLQTIPGIGALSAAVLLELFRRYPGTNRSSIVALAGLDAICKESGTSVHGKRHISKAGSDLLRRILYFSCMRAVRSNDRLQAFYAHLLDHHKPKKVALIACMKKMIMIAYQVYIKKEEYKAMALN